MIGKGKLLLMATSSVRTNKNAGAIQLIIQSNLIPKKKLEFRLKAKEQTNFKRKKNRVMIYMHYHETKYGRNEVFIFRLREKQSTLDY